MSTPVIQSRSASGLAALLEKVTELEVSLQAINPALASNRVFRAEFERACATFRVFVGDLAKDDRPFNRKSRRLALAIFDKHADIFTRLLQLTGECQEVPLEQGRVNLKAKISAFVAVLKRHFT